MLDVAEKCHAYDSVDKGDEGQERANVEERGQGNDESEKQFSDAFGSLDQPQNSPDSEDANDAKESGGDGEIFHHVFHDNAHDAGNHQHEIENVPASREILVPQPDDFDETFWKV